MKQAKYLVVIADKEEIISSIMSLTELEVYFDTFDIQLELNSVLIAEMITDIKRLEINGYYDVRDEAREYLIRIA